MVMKPEALPPELTMEDYDGHSDPGSTQGNDVVDGDVSNHETAYVTASLINQFGAIGWCYMTHHAYCTAPPKHHCSSAWSSQVRSHTFLNRASTFDMTTKMLAPKCGSSHAAYMPHFPASQVGDLGLSCQDSVASDPAQHRKHNDAFWNQLSKEQFLLSLFLSSLSILWLFSLRYTSSQLQLLQFHEQEWIPYQMCPIDHKQLWPRSQPMV